MKKNNPDLRRSIKYDDDAMDLVADYRLTPTGPWKRFTPAGAAEAIASEPEGLATSGPEVSSGATLSGLIRPRNDNNTPSS